MSRGALGERQTPARLVASDRGAIMAVMRNWLLLVAAQAGSVDEATLDAVEQVLSTTGTTRRAWLDGERDLGQALDALDDGIPVVVGGDGALHHVLAALDGRGLLDSRPVGLLPMGTANDLARSAGVSLDAVAAARSIADGASRTLGLADGDLGLVCNAAHAGVGVHAAEVAGRLKERFGGRLGRLAYPLGSARAGLSAPAEAVSVTVDGQTVWDGPALLVGVGVGRTIGGGRPLFADTDPADRRLDVVVMGWRGPLGRVRLAAAVARGSHPQLPDTVTVRGLEVQVASSARRWDVDGELIDAPARVALRLRSGWRLLGADGSGE